MTYEYNMITFVDITQFVYIHVKLEYGKFDIF